MERTLEIILLASFAMFLFITNAKLFYTIDPDKIPDKSEFTIDQQTGQPVYGKDTFSFKNIRNESVLTAIIKSITFSLMTVAIIGLFGMRIRNVLTYFIIIVSFAVSDGFLSFIYHNTQITVEMHTWFSSFFYGIYTAMIVVSFGVFKWMERNGNEPKKRNVPATNGKRNDETNETNDEIERNIMNWYGAYKDKQMSLQQVADLVQGANKGKVHRTFKKYGDE